jgi:hypothetical protein
VLQSVSSDEYGTGTRLRDGYRSRKVDSQSKSELFTAWNMTHIFDLVDTHPLPSICSFHRREF